MDDAKRGGKEGKMMADGVGYIKLSREQIREALLRLYPELADQPERLAQLIEIGLELEEYAARDANDMILWVKPEKPQDGDQ